MREKKFTKGKLVVSSSLMVVRENDALVVHSGSASMMMPEGLAPTFEEAAANAHLIAASPALLEALEESEKYFLDVISGNDTFSQATSVRKKISDAIAKAYGEES